MQPYFVDNFYNASATYTASVQAHKALEAARAQVAHWLGARSSEIIFTAGGTEANNLAIHGIMRRFPGANLVLSGIEHESVLAPAARYGARIAKVGSDGRVSVEDLRDNVDDQTVLISLMYANNEVGTIQPLREVGRMVADIRRARLATGNDLPLYLHTDACQAANYLDIHTARLGVDLLTLNGGKVYGPKQSGALYVKAGIELVPLIDGGGQERGLRSGTENIAGVVGFAAALDAAQTMRHSEVERLSALQRLCIGQLEEQLPQIIINGSRGHRLPNNVHITVPGHDNERLLIELDEAGIMAAAGSACSASDETPSHVLRAMGLTDDDAQASMRFTFGRQTTEAMIDITVRTLARLVA
jgi:cysteine desulfurase